MFVYVDDVDELLPALRAERITVLRDRVPCVSSSLGWARDQPGRHSRAMVTEARNRLAAIT